MDKGSRARVRLVEEGGLSAEDILRMAEPGKRQGKLDVWLSNQDEYVSALFWETMALVKKRGSPFNPVYRTFMEKFADGKLPVGFLQASRVVDARLSDR